MGLCETYLNVMEEGVFFEYDFRRLFTAVVIVILPSIIRHSNAVAVARIVITLARLGDDDGRNYVSPSSYQCAHDIDLNAYTGVYTAWLLSA